MIAGIYTDIYADPALEVLEKASLAVDPRLVARLWARTAVTPHCWEWQGARTKTGHGNLRSADGKKMLSPHRVSYEIHNGPIPAGLIVRHKCDNPPCVNPEHLELGTRADNSRDMVQRGRSTRGERHPTAKLTWEQVDEIRSYPPYKVRHAELAERYGVTTGCIRDIRYKNGNWRHEERA